MADPLSVTASIIAVLQLSSVVVRYVTSASGATNERRRLRSEIRQCECFLNRLKDEIDDVDEGRMWRETIIALEGEGAPLHQLTVALTVVKAKLEPQQGLRKALTTIKWPLDKRDVEMLIATIERQKTLLESALANDCRYAEPVFHRHSALETSLQWVRKLILAVKKSSDESSRQLKELKEMLCDIQDSQASIYQHHLEEEGRRIVSWLSSLDYRTVHEQNLDTWQAGTNQWILDHPDFTDWIEGKTKVLWCHGIPGAGKSIMASFMISHLESTRKRPGTGVGIIFFDYKRQDSTSVDSLLLSVIQQLLSYHYALHKTLPTCVKNLYRHGNDSPSRDDFAKIPSIIEAVASHYENIFIVVDALDECREDIQKSFVEQLRSLPISDLRLFFTSRWSPKLQSIFENQRSIEVTAKDEDIEVFVISQIQSRARLGDQVKRDPSLEKDIIRGVTNKASGMFLLAKFHLDSLATKNSPASVREALKDLPATLHLTYQKSMDRIRSQNPDDIDLALRILKWVTFASRPLRVKEMQHAIAAMKESRQGPIYEDELATNETILLVCVGLVKLVYKPGFGGSEYFAFVHYTAREYFDKMLREGSPHPEASLATACIAYLSFGCFSKGICRTDEEFKARLLSNPLYDYAARNWGHHARAASLGLEKPILEFLGSAAKVCASSQVITSSKAILGYDSRSPSGITPMHIVAYFGLVETMTCLIDSGHDAGVRDAFWRTPLWWAAESGQDSIVKKLLLEERLEARSRDKSGETPLFRAIQNGHELIVNVLVSHEEDVDYVDEVGRTPLTLAAEVGDKAVVRLLLVRGAKVNLKDWKEQTPLSCAAENGHDEIVKLLLENGAMVDSRDDGGRTPLWWSTENQHEQVIELLLAAGADVNIPDSECNQTPLSWATQRGHEGVAKQLVRASSVNVNWKDSLGQTPLSWAARNGQAEMAKLLLEVTEVDINSKDSWGQTPLWWADEYKHTDVAKLLLAAGGIKLGGGR